MAGQYRGGMCYERSFAAVSSTLKFNDESRKLEKLLEIRFGVDK